MHRDIFTNFLKDLSKLNPNELTVVTYDESKHLLIFRQINHMILASYLTPYFLPKKGFKVGVLTQSGLNKLMYNLNNLLGSNLIDNDQIIPDLQVLGLDWYRSYNSATLPSPQKYISLEFVNITSKFFTWILCTTYNNNSKIIYKAVKNERKLIKTGQS